MVRGQTPPKRAPSREDGVSGLEHLNTSQTISGTIGKITNGLPPSGIHSGQRRETQTTRVLASHASRENAKMTTPSGPTQNRRCAPHMVYKMVLPCLAKMVMTPCPENHPENIGPFSNHPSTQWKNKEYLTRCQQIALELQAHFGFWRLARATKNN